MVARQSIDRTEKNEKRGLTATHHPLRQCAGSPTIRYVRWSQETLENAPAVFGQRAKRDGRTFGEFRFREDQLELDAGEGET
ncbi:MAG: hypothetical protein A2W31_13025 [Planctomycetes bacterium RBG_16_64_10]|nr:MAG: hypothetical protein A2W31_13025 [Planctomycetes bacterium RBG_16_64_10]